jgi:hypothetical protein
MEAVGIRHSLLNNNFYNTKPMGVKVLDVLTSPIRGVMGGVNVTAPSGKVGRQLPTILKIGLLALFIIASPLGALSLILLAVKFAVCTHLKEKATIDHIVRLTYR